MLNIALLLVIVLIILSVAAVNILGFEAPDLYGTFGLGTYIWTCDNLFLVRGTFFASYLVFVVRFLCTHLSIQLSVTLAYSVKNGLEYC